MCPGEVHQGRLRRQVELKQEVRQVRHVRRGQQGLQESVRDVYQTYVSNHQCLLTRVANPGCRKMYFCFFAIKQKAVKAVFTQ